MDPEQTDRKFSDGKLSVERMQIFPIVCWRIRRKKKCFVLDKDDCFVFDHDDCFVLDDDDCLVLDNDDAWCSTTTIASF